MFQKLVTFRCLGVISLLRDTFHPHQDCEQFYFYKNCVFISLVRPSQTRKSQFFLQMGQNWNLSNKIGQNILFLSTISATL